MRMTETISILNHLTGVCRDCEQLCGALARSARGAPSAALMQTRAEEWARQGDELQALVLLAGGAPVTAASAAAVLQGSLWRALSLLHPPREPALLRRWQDLQQRAAEHYESALAERLPERIRRTIALQARRVRGRCTVAGVPAATRALHFPTG